MCRDVRYLHEENSRKEQEVNVTNKIRTYKINLQELNSVDVCINIVNHTAADGMKKKKSIKQHNEVQNKISLLTGDLTTLNNEKTLILLFSLFPGL